MFVTATDCADGNAVLRFTLACAGRSRPSCGDWASSSRSAVEAAVPSCRRRTAALMGIEGQDRLAHREL
jgi:hypothetical protein